MRDGWLKGFADYLLEKGIRDYPEVSDFKALLFRGKFQRERLTLEKMREVLDTDSCHLGEYCAKRGSELQKVRTAVSFGITRLTRAAWVSSWRSRSAATGLARAALAKVSFRLSCPVGCRRPRPRADLPGNREEATLKV